MADELKNQTAHDLEVLENEKQCISRLRYSQIGLLDAFAFEYMHSGRLSRNKDQWGMSVERDIYFALMAAGVRQEDKDVAAGRIILAWGESYAQLARGRAKLAVQIRQVTEAAPKEVVGFVYVLTNPCLPGLVKIGMTAAATVELRARQLSCSTSIPAPFDVVASIPCENPRECEAAIHAELASYRVHGKEFFELPCEMAVETCLRHAGVRV